MKRESLNPALIQGDGNKTPPSDGRSIKEFVGQMFPKDRKSTRLNSSH